MKHLMCVAPHIKNYNDPKKWAAVFTRWVKRAASSNDMPPEPTKWAMKEFELLHYMWLKTLDENSRELMAEGYEPGAPNYIEKLKWITVRTEGSTLALKKLARDKNPEIAAMATAIQL